MDYIDSYKEVFGTRRFMSKEKVAIGNFVQFTYDGEQKYAVVLNPNWQGKMHAIAVKTLPIESLKKLLTEISGITNPDEIYDKYRQSAYTADRPYRTYTIDKISALRQIFLKKKKPDVLPSHPAASLPFVELVPIGVIKQYMEYPSRPITQELMDSIRREGIKEPLHITYYQKDNTALLVEGNHRVLAAERVGYQSVPVRVHRSEGPWIGGMGLAPRPVRGATPNEYGYVPADLKPSQIGII